MSDSLRKTKYVGIMETPSARRRIYLKWWNIKENCSIEFKDFHYFCDWAIESGYDETANLKRFDSRGKYSEENCYWEFPGETDNDKAVQKSIEVWNKTESIESWNKTVNRIRKYYGMPPVEERGGLDED